MCQMIPGQRCCPRVWSRTDPAKLGAAIKLVISLALFAPVVTVAQTGNNAIRWIAVSAGNSIPGVLSVGASYTKRRPTMLKLAFTSSSDFSTSQPAGAASLSVGPGLAVSAKRVLFAGAAGPSIVYGRRENRGEAKLAAGLDLSTQLIIEPLRDIGIGIELSQNANRVRSVTGIRLCFAFGRFR